MEMSVELHHIQSFSTQALAAQSRSSRRSEELSCTCHLFVEDLASLVGGLSDGQLIVWRSKKTHAQTSSIHTISLQGHHGRIHALKCVTFDAYSLVFSGSADRSIRIWNPWTENSDRSCTQTLIGHNGTITSIEYARDMLITSSTDRTIRIWKSDDERGMLLYPWFVQHQVINEFDDWVTSLFCRIGETMTIYAGDSRGDVSMFVCKDESASNVRVEAFRPRQHVHERGISHLLVVTQENFVVTLSYDCTVQVHDALNGTGFFAIENPNRCRFTGVAWVSKKQEMLLVDALGYLQIWNVYSEKCMKIERLREGELNGISSIEGSNIVVSAPECIEVWQILREVKFREFKGHSGPVIALALVQKSLGSKSDIVYSASLDNTVRCWNEEMTCFSMLREPRSEISCLCKVPHTNLLFTGLDNGYIHLWNVDSGSTISMKGHTNSVTSMTIAQTRKREFLLSGSFDGRVIIWDITRRKSMNPREEHVLVAGDHEILTVAYNLSNETVLAGGNDHCVHIWELDSLEHRGKLSGHTGSVTCIALDANIIFTGSDDFSIKGWDSQYLFCLFSLQDINSLVSCSFDGQLLIWDYTKGVVKKRFSHKEQIGCMLYDPRRRQVLVGTEEASIVIFKLPEDLYEIEHQDLDEIISSLVPMDMKSLGERYAAKLTENQE